MTEHKVVFTPAEYMDSFDAACPQQAYHELALASPFTAPDGMPLVTRMAELVALNRHPAVHATDGVHFNLGGKRPLIPLDLDGAEHTRFRRLLDPLFSPKSVARLSDQVRELTNALIDGFAGKGEVELFEAFCVPLPSQIFIRLLGLPMSDLPRFVAFKDATVRPDGATDEERDACKARAGEAMYAYLQDVLEQRRREPPRDDLIGGFLTTEVGGDRLSGEHIIDICYLLVIAGLDTVTSSISCLVAWLAQHPEERDRLVQDPSRIPAAIEELMRVESPVHLGHRWIAEDIEIEGRRFQGGNKVMVVWASANLDPDAISDPLRVDMERTDCRHVSFASGFHRCLGSNLARLELRIALEQLHRRIPDYRITPGAAPVCINYGVRAAIQLPLSFTPSPC
jgi:cytochrome P450